jgi:predicted amidohydrolase
MSDFLNVALVQADTSYDSVEGNLSMLEEMISGIQGKKTDIFLFPELFNTGYRNAFSARPEPMNGISHRWMKLMAERTGAVMAGSITIAEGGKVFNRLLFVRPDGITQFYDKVNVFAYSGEDKVFSPGQDFPRFDWLDWNIKPMICFDLRFPETARNEAPFYDLILIPAHWPNARISAWDRLLAARAIENQAYLVAVNRVGSEGETVYTGHSTVLDFMGNPLPELVLEDAGIFCFSLEKEKLLQFRKSFPFLK